MRYLNVALFITISGCGSSSGDVAGDDPQPGAENGGSPQANGGGAQPSGGSGGTAVTSNGGSASNIGGKGGAGNTAGSGGGGARGGGAGAGGAGSNLTGADAGPHPPVIDAGPVRPCSGLPAAGTWENISPFVAVVGDASGKNYAEAVIVDLFDPSTVWFGSGYRGIWKSTDCGASFARVNTGRNATKIDNGSHVSMVVDPVERGVMYVISIYGDGGLWKSTNAGVDWDNMWTDGSELTRVTHNFSDSISMDPTDHRHLVVGMHTNCEAPYNPTCEGVTTDGGATWTIVKMPTPGWQEGAGPWVIDANTWLDAGQDLWLTTNKGSTWSNVSPAGKPFFSGGEVETMPIARGADGTYFLSSQSGVVRSTDGRSWSVIPSSGGRTVGLVMGNGNIYTSDQWSKTYHVGSASDPTSWKVIAPPAALPQDQGAPFLAYDSAHHILYSSNFAAGLWRLVTP